MRKPHIRVTLSAADLDERFARDVTVPDVAADLGCTERAIRLFAARHDVTLPRKRAGRRPPPTPAVRQPRYLQLEDVDWL